MRASFRYDRSWRFDAPVDRVWEALAHTQDYPRWWRWLDDLDVGRLETGSIATFRVRPPLPYSLRFVVRIDEVVEKERVDATVSGDVCGTATLVLSPTAPGTQARIMWQLELNRPVLRFIEPIAHRVMVVGHDLVMAWGVRQFRRRALVA